MFTCGHRFCKECTIASLKECIERAELDKVKCFDHECQQPIEMNVLRDILGSGSALFAKYERFKDKKALEADPLVRWCTKPGCESHMRAPNKDAKKLTCPECGTEICFQCKEPWHGEDVSCEEAMAKEFGSWLQENRDKVSFCPCCKSRIEKNMGCNHMTCGFCGYEFCWACGGSASSADNHWTNGCGITMMQENVKPGDHLKLPQTTRAMVTHTLGQRATRILTGACHFLLGLLCMAIMYPLFLVFFCPIMGGVIATERANRLNSGRVMRAILFIGGVLGGFAADICFIPGVLLLTACWLCIAILGCFAILYEWVTGRRVQRNGRPIVSLDPAGENMRRAQERLRERAAAGE